VTHRLAARRHARSSPAGSARTGQRPLPGWLVWTLRVGWGTDLRSNGQPPSGQRDTGDTLKGVSPKCPPRGVPLSRRGGDQSVHRQCPGTFWKN
jgi:hypothetical protein